MNRRIWPLLTRIWNTAVFWTWMFNGLRFAAGLLLMPLLWRLLSKQDLGIYSLFFQFTGFLLTFDQMFSLTISRFVGYAMRGVKELQSIGIATVENGDGSPNVELLSQLLGVTKRIYHILAVGILLLLGVFGTLLLLPDLQKASDPGIARAAWAITVTSACLELYTGYWLTFMRGLNKVLLSSRLSTLVYGLKLALTVALLASRLGLLAVPVATLVTGLVQRWLARAFLRKNLPAGVAMDVSHSWDLLRRIWPSAWRVGLILFSINVMTVGFGLIISRKWGVADVAPYHFSQQVLYSVCVGMASVWTYVKWPMICQLRAHNDFAGMRRTIWPRLWLQLATYLALAAFFILLGPPLLTWIAPDKQLLPRPWLVVLALYAFLDMQYTFWTTLISTENRIPSLWAAVCTNAASLALAAALAQYTTLGWGAFVIAPLCCGALFNFWFWPIAGAAGMQVSLLRFMLRRPARAEPLGAAAPSGAVAG